MRTFFIRSKNDTGFASLYVKIQKRKPAINLLVNSCVQVDIQSWKRAKVSQAAWNRFVGTKDGSIVFKKIQDIDSAIDNLLEQGIFDKAQIDEAVANVAYAAEREAQRQEEEAAMRQAEEQARLEAEREAARKANVLLYLENHIKGMADGSKKFKGESYALGTVKKWKNFYGILKEFYAEYPFTWNEIDKSLGDAFLLFMEKRGYMAMSVNKYVACFRAMINFAMVEQYHSNPAIKAFSKKK